MRRAELVEACENVIKALDTSNMIRALNSLHDYQTGNAERVRQQRPEGHLEWPAILQSMTMWAVLASRFGPNENTVVEILGLQSLLDPKVWLPGRTGPERPEADGPRTWKLYRACNWTVAHLPAFIKLFKHASSGGLPEDDTSKLRVILIEEEGQSSTPDRLIKVFQGVQELYEVCATLGDAPHHSLSVIACDSGSDKSFDFLGIAKAIQMLKGIIVSMWDRLAFYSDHKTAAAIANIAKALPVVEKIHELKENGMLDAGVAEQLKRKALGGTVKLMECGIVTPEINARTTFNPRQLMAPEVKLLTTGSAVPEDKNGGKTARPKLPKAEVPEAEIVVNFEEEEEPSTPKATEGDDERSVADQRRADSLEPLRDAFREPVAVKRGAVAAGTIKKRTTSSTTDSVNPGGLTNEEAETLMRLMAKVKGETPPVPRVIPNSGKGKVVKKPIKPRKRAET